jgi:hypothetical protein
MTVSPPARRGRGSNETYPITLYTHAVGRQILHSQEPPPAEGSAEATAEAEDALLVSPLEELHLGPENASRTEEVVATPDEEHEGGRHTAYVDGNVVLGQPVAEEQEEEDWLEHARQMERQKKRSDKKKKMQQRDEL